MCRLIDQHKNENGEELELEIKTAFFTFLLLFFLMLFLQHGSF